MFTHDVRVLVVSECEPVFASSRFVVVSRDEVAILREDRAAHIFHYLAVVHLVEDLLKITPLITELVGDRVEHAILVDSWLVRVAIFCLMAKLDAYGRNQEHCDNEAHFDVISRSTVFTCCCALFYAVSMLRNT